MTEENLDFGGTLRFKMWVTRGCYFVVSDRLKRKGRYSVGAITLLSFYVFVISLFTLVFGNTIPSYYPAILSTLSIVLSVFIIIITLLEDSKKYILDAEHASHIAHELEALFNRYEVALMTPPPPDGKFQLEYATVLNSARFTRRAVDYHLFQLLNLNAFKLGWGQIVLMTFYFILETVMEYWIYASMILLPLIAMGLLIYHIVPKWT